MHIQCPIIFRIVDVLSISNHVQNIQLISVTATALKTQARKKVTTYAKYILQSQNG